MTFITILIEKKQQIIGTYLKTLVGIKQIIFLYFSNILHDRYQLRNAVGNII